MYTQVKNGPERTNVINQIVQLAGNPFISPAHVLEITRRLTGKFKDYATALKVVMRFHHDNRETEASAKELTEMVLMRSHLRQHLVNVNQSRKNQQGALKK